MHHTHNQSQWAVVRREVPASEVTVIYRDGEDHRGEYDLVEFVSGGFEHVAELLHVVYDGVLYDVEDVFITLESQDEFTYTMTLPEIVETELTDMNDENMDTISKVEILVETTEGS